MKTSLSLSALAVLMAVPGLAQDYAIKLHQALQVGQRYKFTAVASESTQNSMTAEQQVLKSEKDELSLEMESIVTVLEVDSIGRSIKESHLIVKLLKVPSKQAILPPGTTVIASRQNKKTVFEVEGDPAAPEVAKLLDLAVTITSGGPSDDEIFGTTERKKVGDSWSINEALALKSAKEKTASQALEIERVTGKTTLQKVTKDGDVDVLHLVANLTAKMSPAAKGPFTSAEATMQASMTGAFPTDVSKSVRAEGGTMTMTFKASGKPDPNGPVTQMSATAKRSTATTYKLLK